MPVRSRSVDLVREARPPPTDKSTTEVKVVNVKKAELSARGFTDFQDWLERGQGAHVYIGRNTSFYVKGATGSKYANPFPLKKFTRAESLARYEAYVRSGPLWNTLLEDLGDARELGCWCHPEGCHGDVLERLIAERRAGKPAQ